MYSGRFDDSNFAVHILKFHVELFFPNMRFCCIYYVTLIQLLAIFVFSYQMQKSTFLSYLRYVATEITSLFHFIPVIL